MLVDIRAKVTRLIAMISNEEIINLPDDPKLAFAEYVRLLWVVVNKESNHEDDLVERKFAAHVRAFTETHNVGIKLEPAPHQENDFWAYYNNLRDQLNFFTAKFQLEGLRGGGSLDHGEIELGDDYRTQIHGHLDTVRKIINAVDLEERLRENILRRLNLLEIEVDKNRSGLIRFADALVELTSAVGDGADNLAPAVKIMERIGGVFGKARKENDVKLISGGGEPKQITGPADDAGTDASAKPGDLDDEIPF